MPARMNYMDLAPEGMARMQELEHYLNTGTGLDHSSQELVRLLSSLLNGCEYCIHLHGGELKKLHEPEGRIEGLLEWRASDAFTQRERAALAWAEAVTNIQQGHAADAVFDEVRAHFSEAEIVNLTLTITNINAWNRLAISLGSRPGRG